MVQGLTSTDLAYFAGLLDGEGTLVIYKQDRSKWGNKSVAYRALVGISNTHVPVLQQMKSLFGGKIVEQGKGRGCYNLTFTVGEVRRWLSDVLPYLVVKRSQAEILLKFLNFQELYGFKPLNADVLTFYEECLVKISREKKRRYSFKEQLCILGMKKCAYCSKEFMLTSKSPRKKFCTHSCKNKAGVERFLARLNSAGA